MKLIAFALLSVGLMPPQAFAFAHDCPTTVGIDALQSARGTCIKIKGIDTTHLTDVAQIVELTLPYALGAVHIIDADNSKMTVSAEGPLGYGWMFTAIRTAVYRLFDLPHTAVWLENGKVYHASGPSDVELHAKVVQFDPVSVGILTTAIVAWIIAPYIANKGVFSFAIFFLAIIMVASTAALFMLQRLTEPVTLVMGAVGLVALAASSLGLPVAPTGLALNAVSSLLQASGLVTAEQAKSPELVATFLVVCAIVVVCSIGLFAVFYIPATEERLQSFSFVIRIATLFIAPFAGSSPSAALLCASAPLALQAAGMAVAVYVTIDYCARRLANAIVWILASLCCPCIRCTQCLYRCCCDDRSAGHADDADDSGRPDGGEDSDRRGGRPDVMRFIAPPPDSPEERPSGRGRSSSTSRATRRRRVRSYLSPLQAEEAMAADTTSGLADLRLVAERRPEVFAGRVSDEAAMRLEHFALTGEDVLPQEFDAFDADVDSGRMNLGRMRSRDISQAELEEAMAAEELEATRRARRLARRI